MTLFVPMAHGQKLKHEVYSSINDQTLAMDIIPCISEGVVKSNHNEIAEGQYLKRVECCLASRRMSRSFINALSINDEFVAMQDSDIVHLYTDNFERCLRHISSDATLGMVACSWKPYTISDHIKLWAFVIRTSLLKEYDWIDDSSHHDCKMLKAFIESEGLKSVFIDNKVIIKEISRS